ncbi:MAG: class I SAM-dependent methyltransferase [Acetanaerobacterium sp.]
MSAYHIFAKYYDQLTADVGYIQRAAYFDSLLARHGNGGRLLLDLACGTGSLTVALAQRGYDMIGVDGSYEMLSRAMEKSPENLGIQYLCQTMQGLDMYGTVDACVCALDSINHVTSEKSLSRSFARVALFLDPDGVFLFDANTPSKHENTLADNTFVYDYGDVYCVWQNSYHQSSRTTTIRLDFFEHRQTGEYTRSTEQFEERAYTLAELSAMLLSAGLEIVACYGDDSLDPIKDDTQRMIIAAKKISVTGGKNG